MEWRDFRQALAGGISGVANPPFVAAAAFALAIFGLDEPPARAVVLLGICLVFATVLPTAYVGVLLTRGKIDRFFISERAARLHPLLVVSTICLAGTALLWRASAPLHVQALMLCYAVNGLLAAVCSLRWKVSLHAMGSWMPLSALIFLFGLRGLMLVPLPIAVSWARIELGAHTPAQVLAGGVLAGCSAWLLLRLVLGATPIP